MHTNKMNGSGVNRIFKATHCSINGYKVAWQTESAFRQELSLAIILLPLSFFIAQSPIEWCALAATLALTLIVELLNSALETLADRITLNYDESIKRVKDLGSAAVTTALMLTCLTWGALTLKAIFY